MTALGRYRLVERVATGGMGEVYRGVDTGWGGIERPVAIKVIAPTFAREPEFVRTFQDEARLSFLLSHANVVGVRDIGQTDETYFIAMEWVEGGDLGGILRRLRTGPGQPMPMRFSVLIAIEAARGLDYAHRLRDAEGRPLHVVHRDISPSNLLVSFEGEVKVTDFGIARSRMKSTPSLPGALKGKLGYLAPEQARGEDVDLRADVFALGSVLYEMLTGTNPFTHNATEREVLTRVQSGSFQPPRLLLPALPQGLEAIVLRAMSPDRDGRYASCGTMREDLETFARREGYSLSTSDLGGFVRELFQSPSVDGHSVTEPALKRVSKPRITSPKPFDVALGESLAQLNSGEGEPQEDESDRTAPGKRPADAPRTVAVHAIITPPPTSPSTLDERPAVRKLDSLETEQIPRSYSPRAAFIVAGLALTAVAISVGVSLANRAARPTEVLPPIQMKTAPSPAPLKVEAPAKKSPPIVERTSVERVEKIEKHAALRPARLSVESDITANVYVDGEFVRETPIMGLELPPGEHAIRAESTASGLRLIPREETITLKAGESRHLTMDLK